MNSDVAIEDDKTLNEIPTLTIAQLALADDSQIILTLVDYPESMVHVFYFISLYFFFMFYVCIVCNPLCDDEDFCHEIDTGCTELRVA